MRGALQLIFFENSRESMTSVTIFVDVVIIVFPTSCSYFWREIDHFRRGQGAAVHVHGALALDHFVFILLFESPCSCVWYGS